MKYVSNIEWIFRNYIFSFQSIFMLLIQIVSSVCFQTTYYPKSTYLVWVILYELSYSLYETIGGTTIIYFSLAFVSFRFQKVNGPWGTHGVSLLSLFFSPRKSASRSLSQEISKRPVIPISSLFIKATTLDYLRVVSEKKNEMNIPVLLLVPYQEWYLDLDSRRHICHLRFHLQNETALLKY